MGIEIDIKLECIQIYSGYKKYWHIVVPIIAFEY